MKTPLRCVCGHSALEHLRACHQCRGKAWACKFFVSNDAVLEKLDPVPTLPTQVELFQKARAAA